VNALSQPDHGIENPSEYSHGDFATLIELFTSIEQSIQGIPLDKSSITKQGEFIVDFFEAVNITQSNVDMLYKIIDAACDILISLGGRRAEGLALHHFETCLRTVFRQQYSASEPYSQYRVTYTTYH
jgi:hypothetical protein